MKANVQENDAFKACTPLRRSIRLKRKELAESVSVDVPSLQKEEKKGSVKKRKQKFDVPNKGAFEDKETYDEWGNPSTPPHNPPDLGGVQDTKCIAKQGGFEQEDHPAAVGPDQTQQMDMVPSPQQLQMIVHSGLGMYSPIQAKPIQLVVRTTPPDNRSPPEGSQQGTPDNAHTGPLNGRGQKRVPQKSDKIRGPYTCEARVSHLFASSTKPAYAPIEPLNANKWETFRKTLGRAKATSFDIITGQTVSNGFFLQIAKPTQWLSTPIR
ncbi:unnamed protein product [Microthlaspi erraticum]|uniref:Uncharacterized protein n=1 Tax=Microthlaspi erraticum TaxID=1685480 RepID=A0A6D2J5M7_9BRAS|nr:unnamed protein product [Microthlaspi erraticum]